MTSQFQRLGLAVAITLLLTAPSSGAPLTLQLDPEQTRISFLLPTNTHEVHGFFALDAASVHFDPESGGASGEIRVHATGAETGNVKRDRKMHQKVLKSEKFPFFTFRADRVEATAWQPSGENHLELAGRIEILGSEHPATWIADVQVEGHEVHGTATLDVPFVDWGLSDPSFLVFRVEKVVHVEVELIGTIDASDPRRGD